VAGNKKERRDEKGRKKEGEFIPLLPFRGNWHIGKKKGKRKESVYHFLSKGRPPPKGGKKKEKTG